MTSQTHRKHTHNPTWFHDGVGHGVKRVGERRQPSHPPDVPAPAPRSLSPAPRAPRIACCEERETVAQYRTSRSKIQSQYRTWPRRGVVCQYRAWRRRGVANQGMSRGESGKPATYDPHTCLSTGHRVARAWAIA
eukprot:1080097-Rhodomonas_salina.1